MATRFSDTSRRSLLKARAGGRIEEADGEADVYGVDRPATGLMVNHASGTAVFELLTTSPARTSARTSEVHRLMVPDDG